MDAVVKSSQSEAVKKVLPINEKKKTYLNHEDRILQKMERKLATYQLSCTRIGKETRKRIPTEKLAKSKSQRNQHTLMKHDAMQENEEKHALAEHLRSIAPFNRRWQVTETINEGTYGVVFAVRDVETGVHGVIKVAKSVGNDAGNQAAEWEGFVIQMQVSLRLLDKGMLADQNGLGMEFMVLEKAEFGIIEWLNKELFHIGIYDMHREGLLHRDLKPDNMGILSIDQPFVVLFDLGMTRMYTNEDGECRVPRTTCAFRGTPEWSSGWASKGREQNRFDDLIAWLYVACELYDPSPNIAQPLPWTYRQSDRILAYLKTAYCPAEILLRRAPRQFYEINAYLMTANRNLVPKYKFLADKVMEAINELQISIFDIFVKFIFIMKLSLLLLTFISLFATLGNAQRSIILSHCFGTGTRNVKYETIANNIIDNDGNIIPQTSNKDGCIDIMGKIRQNGEEYERQNGCYYIDENKMKINMKPNTTVEINGTMHYCDDKNDNIRYYTKVVGCMKYGIKYKEGEQFAINHFHYECKNGMIDIIGCYIDDINRKIKINDSIIDKHMLYSCYIENGKVKYEQYPCGLNGFPSCEVLQKQQVPIKMPTTSKPDPGFGVFSIVQHINQGGDKIATGSSSMKFELVKPVPRIINS
ncbi:hypothetical protein DINM_020289 [Dirofilaria immitis]|nr:hypothetical protein [Dirofilaria immitis]